MRPIYLDDDVRESDVGDITPDEADRQRAEYEWAMDVARDAIDRRADLERRALTDPDAALAILKETFRRYNLAVMDGTESERAGWRLEVYRACERYNALTRRPERVA